MNWDQIQVRWKRLKEIFALRGFRATEDCGRRLELLGAEVSADDQSDAQRMPFQPDDDGRRSEFSLHIGC